MAATVTSTTAGSASPASGAHAAARDLPPRRHAGLRGERGQKKGDVHEYCVDAFVIGDDWEGKLRLLKEEGLD